MTRVELKFHSYRYFPYEQRLAELEVERLLGLSRSGSTVHYTLRP